MYTQKPAKQPGRYLSNEEQPGGLSVECHAGYVKGLRSQSINIGSSPPLKVLNIVGSSPMDPNQPWNDPIEVSLRRGAPPIISRPSFLPPFLSLSAGRITPRHLSAEYSQRGGTNDGSTARLGMTPNRPDRGRGGARSKERRMSIGKENAMAAHQAKGRHLRTDIRSRRMTYQESEASRYHFFAKSCQGDSMGSNKWRWSSFSVLCASVGGYWLWTLWMDDGGLKVLQTCSNFKVEIGAWIHATALGKPGGTRLECSRRCDGPGLEVGVAGQVPVSSNESPASQLPTSARLMSLDWHTRQDLIGTGNASTLGLLLPRQGYSLFPGSQPLGFVPDWQSVTQNAWQAPHRPYCHVLLLGVHLNRYLRICCSVSHLRSIPTVICQFISHPVVSPLSTMCQSATPTEDRTALFQHTHTRNSEPPGFATEKGRNPRPLRVRPPSTKSTFGSLAFNRQYPPVPPKKPRGPREQASLDRRCSRLNQSHPPEQETSPEYLAEARSRESQLVSSRFLMECVLYKYAKPTPAGTRYIPAYTTESIMPLSPTS
ncbi:uncharacterized protein CLUP02_10304 [Colletotrichum lupini]|uniref:Uncharacterized protein n=1 Tax=Colletotrichum lupini TaxID=145971 RepID=A0A9Q8SWJ8_9PEZI|nr:uncharacterized protein CLUP02_10304 [Colletotrichum lupini]UQC84808.1 hypothetical protein CLUP02_10304 [Colletotrichum lupini]